ncbi:MAG: hypothetical protein JAZ18_15125 [Candidatus Thiodiazotropha endolucinida]|nr:hypothetical protein [Candidatus Thiodiazotropha endolucinida]
MIEGRDLTLSVNWFSVTTLSIAIKMMSDKQSTLKQVCQGADRIQVAVERFCDGCNCS